MKVKALNSLSQFGYPVYKHTELEMKDEDAKRLIELGFVESLETKTTKAKKTK